MKNKRYTNEEILEISKLLSEGITCREIAIMLNRDRTRLIRKINELGLYRFKKINPRALKMTINDKLKYYNDRLNLYFNKGIEL